MEVGRRRAGDHAAVLANVGLLVLNVRSHNSRAHCVIHGSHLILRILSNEKLGNVRRDKAGTSGYENPLGLVDLMVAVLNAHIGQQDSPARESCLYRNRRIV